MNLQVSERVFCGRWGFGVVTGVQAGYATILFSGLQLSQSYTTTGIWLPLEQVGGNSETDLVYLYK